MVVCRLQRKVADAQESEAALRHSLLLSPAMRGTRIIAGTETRLQELYGDFRHHILPTLILCTFHTLYSDCDFLEEHMMLLEDVS